MKITVKPISKENYEIDVEPSTTIYDLKMKLHNKYKYNQEFLNVIYDGNILDNTKTLEFYNINDGSSIVIMESGKRKRKYQSDNVNQSAPPYQSMQRFLGQICLQNSNNHTIINFTPSEIDDINDMISMGFSENDILQIYIMCNRNKEVAVNILLENFN